MLNIAYRRIETLSRRLFPRSEGDERKRGGKRIDAADPDERHPILADRLQLVWLARAIFWVDRIYALPARLSGLSAVYSAAMPSIRRLGPGVLWDRPSLTTPSTHSSSCTIRPSAFSPP